MLRLGPGIRTPSPQAPRNSYGLMRCLDPAAGDRIWEDATTSSQVRRRGPVR